MTNELKLYGIKYHIEYEQLLSRFIWPIDVTLIVIATSAQSGLGSNGNQAVLKTPKNRNFTIV